MKIEEMDQTGVLTKRKRDAIEEESIELKSNGVEVKRKNSEPSDNYPFLAGAASFCDFAFSFPTLETTTIVITPRADGGKTPSPSLSPKEKSELKMVQEMFPMVKTDHILRLLALHSHNVHTVIEVLLQAPDREYAEKLQTMEQNQLKNLEESQKMAKDFENALELCKTQIEETKHRELKKVLQEKEMLNELLRSNSVVYPLTWKPQSEDYKLFLLESTSPEFEDVCTRVLQSLPQAIISQIFRVQNQRLYKRYYRSREEIGNNNNGFFNEHYLFHGSHSSNIQKIIQEGLDTRVASLSGAIGAGIYFASRASTSLQYVNYRETPIAQMLFCRVTLGNITRGFRGLRRPPPRPEGGLYDSVDGFLGSDQIYAIFDNGQSYPEYLICFQFNPSEYNYK